MRGTTLAAGVLGCLWLVAPAAAQSLADVAKKEQVRREAVAGSGKVYTNGDLTPDPFARSTEPPVTGAVALPDAAAQDADAPAVAADPAAPPSAEATPAEAAPMLDEAYWRRQAAARRARVEEARQRLALVSVRSEGNERQQAKMAELKATAEGVLARAEASLAALEREAQSLGVPEAWIR